MYTKLQDRQGSQKRQWVWCWNNCTKDWSAKGQTLLLWKHDYSTLLVISIITRFCVVWDLEMLAWLSSHVEM